MNDTLIKILESFNIGDKVIEYTPLGNGHINSTFLCKTDNGKMYVLQRINNYVFKDVDVLMDNYFKVTDFLINQNIETIHIIKTKEGKPYCHFEDKYYRLYDYIDNVVWYERIDSNELIRKAGKAFGRFHKILKGFDASLLHEVIPNFHNTYQRYINLLDAIKEDKLSRVKDCKKEIEIVESYKLQFDIITAAIKQGSVPLAVTHNDPKINNVLFDKTSGEIRAVIDLDTVMPGSYLYDYGDALRSLFTGDNEDSENLSLLKVDFDIFTSYSAGYLSEMKNILTRKEVDLLPFSSFLLTIECGIRFLEDFIRGDVYFKTHKPDHNLIRARTQLTLAEDIFNNLNKMKEIIEDLM